MERRDLIKAGILVAGGAAIGAGINSKKAEQTGSLSITPQQTKPFEFYAPMPFRFDLLDQMAEMNTRYRKSQIKTVYNNIPNPLFSEFEEQFQGYKGENPDIKSFEDFAKSVKHAMDLGFKFVYILNSPKPFSEKDFYKHKTRFYKLLDNIEKLGCREIKIANHQLMKIVSEAKPHFNLSASTSFEFHNISQYENLITTYPQIKSMNTSIDDNRNLLYLKNLRRRFPDTDIELMVNERCIHGCPARISHTSTFFACWDCWGLRAKIGAIKYFLKSNVIYPWWLPYYQAIGINTFKFFSLPMRANMDSVGFMDNYLHCVELGIDNITANDFFNYMYGIGINIKNNVKLSEIIPHLPKIEHFIQNGNKCANICGLDCNYCTKGVKEIEKILGL